MQREQGLTTLHALPDTDMEINTGSRVRRSPSELGGARQPPAVNAGDSPSRGRRHFELLRAGRGGAHPTLRFADGLQLSPGTTIVKRGAGL
jgi:hypothetical protein